MTTIQAEHEHTINGVPGRHLGATIGGTNYREGTFTRQRWAASKMIDYHGERAQMTVTLRFDDDCRNGHNTFSATADVVSLDRRRRDRDIAGGCLHEDIAKHFPGLAPLLRWHLVSTDGPMHYEANTVYLAGDRDHWGVAGRKPRDLDAARSTAVWPEATDADLCAEPEALREALRARLPKLLEEFRAAMVDVCGFAWSSESI